MYDRNPESKTWNGWVLFPELRRNDREMRFSYIKAGSIRVAVNKAVSGAMEKRGHLCGQRPSKIVIFLESLHEDFDEEGNVISRVTEVKQQTLDQ